MKAMGSGGDMKAFYRQHKHNTSAAAITKKSNAKPKSSFSSSPAALLHPDVEAAAASEEERMLHEFDMDMRYGPCLGLTRMERWDRASSLGLTPPPAVEALLLLRSGGCLWEGRV